MAPGVPHLTESSELIAGKFWIGLAIEKGALKAF